MKYLIALALATPTAAHADAFTNREIAFQVLNMADAATTIDCLNRDVCHETNPILGRRPTTGGILAFKAAEGALHYFIARELNKRDPKAARIFQTVSIVFQGGVVASNLRFTF
jgi:hypothetical protein